MAAEATMHTMNNNQQKGGNTQQQNMQQKTSLTYDDKVVKKIAGLVAQDVPGILAMSGGLISHITEKITDNENVTKGIGAEVGKKQVALDLDVICEYNRNIPQIFKDTIDKVTKTVKDMTGLDVIEINMHVDDVMTKKEYEEQQNNNNNNSRVDNDNNNNGGFMGMGGNSRVQ